MNHGFNGRLAGTWLTMRWLTGLIGLVGVAVVMTYPLRKQVYRRRAGALRYWLLAHIYVAAIAGVVLLLHSGTQTGGLLTTSLYVTFDFVIATGILAIVSYVIAPRIMTSIEGEPLLIEDLVGRQLELRNEFEKTVSKSQGWLRDELEERVRKRFFSVGFLLRQLVRREELRTLLADARQEFKEDLTRTATDDERVLLQTAVETAVTLRRVDALIFLHRLVKYGLLHMCWHLANVGTDARSHYSSRLLFAALAPTWQSAHMAQNRFIIIREDRFRIGNDY